MALVAPNGWISVDLGWNLVGYFQDGLSVPFGPTEIGSRVLQGGFKNAINKAFLALGGSGGSKWMDLSGYWLELGGIHPEWSEGTIWTHQNCPQGGVRNSTENAIKMVHSGNRQPWWL